ncbi:MAG: bifunctional adenosylcobinamide hydrolase/alpha-ribazole phosphatase CbiS [Nitrososphaerales archaeon]|nr:bifunctional adenosylcobinamide hydrolase/alpha-ribazole phosphatase CbiS [Nitrososphaerales archaeon]
MRIDVKISQVECEIKRGTLVIRFNEPLNVLSSAVLNGGLFRARAIINHHVPKSFDHRDPAYILRNLVKNLGLADDTVGFMTAVEVHNVAIRTERVKDLVVSALVTAGLSYPATAGDDTLQSSDIGTINIILLIDGNLTDSCIVNCIQTAIEAKTVALRELDVRSRFSNSVASGSTSDAIAVACTGVGEPIKFAGTGTEIGIMIGRIVKEATKEAIQKQDGTMQDRSIIERLKERGISIEDMVETGLKLFTPSHEIGSREKASELLREGLIRALSDANVSVLIMAALRLQEDGEMGSIPNLPKDKFLRDPISLVADESIGIAIANYISGTWGFYNFLYFERKKPGMIKKLGPFLDDAMSGLIAGVLSDIYRRSREE